MKLRTRLLAGVAGALLLLGQRSAAAELPLKTFFRYFRYTDVELSPDGRFLAALTPLTNHVGLSVTDLESSEARWAFFSKDFSVAWFTWANTNRLLLQVARGGYRNPGLIAVDRDGSDPVVLPAGTMTHFLGLLPGSPDEILVTTLLNSKPPPDARLLYPNVERVNLQTGKTTPVVVNPGHVVMWLPDHAGSVRVGVAVELTRIKVIYRRDAHAPWEIIANYEYNEKGIWPVGFDDAQHSLLVRWEGEGTTRGLYSYDPMKKQLGASLIQHPEADLRNVLFSRKRGVPIGVTYETDRLHTEWLDPGYRQMQASVDAVLTNTVNLVVSRTDDDSKAVFLAFNDRTPGTYYLFDSKTMTLQKFRNVAEWINPEQMAEMKPIEYKSRDGLTIHGYLTLPLRHPEGKLPMVVMPHGGPIFRDSWGFNGGVQFLANRGYAVLQVNFRGSAGYGSSFEEAGFKQWGLKQQDDITDGVNWATEQGIADAKRIAIVGASYGGYAALMGLEKTPELYRCGVSYAGPTDLLRMLTGPEFHKFMITRAAVAEKIGDSKKDRQSLKERSPLTHAEAVQVPVLLAYGAWDPKVPIEPAREMAQVLKKRGKLYDFIEKNDEGHGFIRQTNIIEFWKKTEQLLKANIGP